VKEKRMEKEKRKKEIDWNVENVNGMNKLHMQ